MKKINIAAELKDSEWLESWPTLLTGTSAEFYRFALQMLQKDGRIEVTEEELAAAVGQRILADIAEIREEEDAKACDCVAPTEPDFGETFEF